MAPHLIRLRAAWDWHPSDPALGEGEARRVDLPTVWPAGRPDPFRLVRRFQSPRIDPQVETLALSLEAVAGLRSVWLNGRELARPPAGTDHMTIDLTGSLPARNLLVLEIDPADWGPAGPGSEPWGSIALAIQPV